MEWGETDKKFIKNGGIFTPSWSLFLEPNLLPLDPKLGRVGRD